MTKKLSITLLLLVVAVCTVAAGGAAEQTSDESNAEPVRVVIWTGITDDRGPQAIVDRFNAANPDIILEHRRFVNNPDGNTRLDTALIGNEQVDIYANYDFDLFTRRAENGLALDLSELFASNDFDLRAEFGEVGSQGVIDGAPYGIPAALSNEVVYYNKTRMDELGITIEPDWTWEDFVRIADQATDRSTDPPHYGAMLFPWGEFLFARWGGTVLGADYRYSGDGANYENPIFEEILQLHYQMEQIDESAVPLAELTATRLAPQVEFVNGNTFMIGPTSGWILGLAKDRTEYPRDFEIAVAPIPRRTSDQNPYYHVVAAGDIFAINPRSENLEAAWRVLEFWTTEGFIEHTPAGRIPAWTGFSAEEAAMQLVAADGSDLINVESLAEHLILSPDDVVSIRTNNLAAPELNQISAEEYQAVLLGTKTVEEGLADLQERAERAIDAARSRQ